MQKNSIGTAFGKRANMFNAFEGSPEGSEIINVFEGSPEGREITRKFEEAWSDLSLQIGHEYRDLHEKLRPSARSEFRNDDSPCTRRGI